MEQSTIQFRTCLEGRLRLNTKSKLCSLDEPRECHFVHFEMPENGALSYFEPEGLADMYQFVSVLHNHITE